MTRCSHCGSLECGPIRCRFTLEPQVSIRPEPKPIHDFRDRYNPVEKVDSDPNHWSRWSERP